MPPPDAHLARFQRSPATGEADGEDRKNNVIDDGEPGEPQLNLGKFKRGQA
jgi:hypothetical protein